MKEPFKLEGRKIPVRISLFNLERQGDFRFILDTGASHSVFDLGLIRTMGFTPKDFVRNETLRGFGGNRVSVPFLKISKVNSLGLSRRNFEIGCTEFSSTFPFDGILGIDFFLNHKLTIDFKSGQLELV